MVEDDGNTTVRITLFPSTVRTDAGTAIFADLFCGSSVTVDRTAYPARPTGGIIGGLAFVPFDVVLFIGRESRKKVNS